jgi:hypothetical protein
MPSFSRKKLKKTLRSFSQVGSVTFRDLSCDAETTVLLSSGRSGSTWLGDLICTLPQTRVIFEPFHPNNGMRDLTEYRYTYSDPSASFPLLQQSFQALVTGRRRSQWTEQFNKASDFVYRRRLLKLIRSNLLFPWMTSHFPNYRYIFLIRHPAAVVLSQLHGNWTLSARRLLSQPDLQDAYELSKFDSFNWPESGFLSNMIFWAIENEVAPLHAQQVGALIVHYEKLCIEPQKEMHRIEEYLGVKFPPTLRNNFYLSSWSRRRSVGSLSVNDKISKWTAQISPDDLTNVEAVLHHSRLSEFYGTGPMPLHQ